MYGLKRVEYYETGKIKAIDIDPDTPPKYMKAIFLALELPLNLPFTSDEQPEKKEGYFADVQINGT